METCLNPVAGAGGLHHASCRSEAHRFSPCLRCSCPSYLQAHSFGHINSASTGNLSTTLPRQASGQQNTTPTTVDQDYKTSMQHLYCTQLYCYRHKYPKNRVWLSEVTFWCWLHSTEAVGWGRGIPLRHSVRRTHTHTLCDHSIRAATIPVKTRNKSGFIYTGSSAVGKIHGAL